MHVSVVKDYTTLSKRAATLIAGQVLAKPNAVLGLATGSTPVGTYQQLVDLYKQDVVDFGRVISFNLDEYYGVGADSQFSYAWYMQQNLFKHINIDPDNAHIPDGLTTDVERECAVYEDKIRSSGGIDLQLLGIGHNGHIGFNEPQHEFATTTHLVDLDDQTIAANARFFESEDQVPRQAISMGIGSIMQARRIVLLAAGEDKAQAVYNLVRGSVTPQFPASVLHLHADVQLIVDEAAAVLLF